ncbi:unnamed protein product [Zymoseptoria tritici ST99CH_1E4]|uniref:F-box domain-containing protein n=1 Tax=Zymoseptoria tritici ST99CH_1E4 TaxID=1276532 RepID=A0A2H1FLS2_ZYMTR|nr:unnamed protein product [Zymoseptoria tritici ST99CH_1E4]
MELSAAPNANHWSARLVTKLGGKLRSEKHYSQDAAEKKRRKDSSKLQKRGHQRPAVPEVNELGEQEYAIFAENRRPARRKEQDLGEMMHGLAYHDDEEDLPVEEKPADSHFSTDKRRRRRGYMVSQPHERRVASLPDELWKTIAFYLNPSEACQLALSSKTLYSKLGVYPFERLNLPCNKNHKIAFLHQFDSRLPNHLLCFPCRKYHLRLNPGKEVLKMDYINNPIFHCPNVKSSVLPRTRLTYARTLPYSFVQLALRSHHFSPAHGIDPDSLSRRWKCKDSGWTHATRYTINDDRLLLRVVSQRFAPPASSLSETAERHLLYDREEYVPFFSVCAHWRDGDLMKICKCMLSHIPAPPDPYRKQLQRGFVLDRAAAKPDFIVRGCDDCRPARRCPECPTEYMVEARLMEDEKDKENPFKHAIVVTRWTDLGDGMNPYTSPEWTAINGMNTNTGGEDGDAVYDSFTNVGRRAVGGIFESKVSGSTPGNRLLSLNPSNKKMGEGGSGWY